MRSAGPPGPATTREGAVGAGLGGTCNAADRKASADRVLVCILPCMDDCEWVRRARVSASEYKFAASGISVLTLFDLLDLLLLLLASQLVSADCDLNLSQIAYLLSLL